MGTFVTRYLSTVNNKLDLNEILNYVALTRRHLKKVE